MKLELKHIIGYLPYGLKVYTKYYDAIVEPTSISKDDYLLDELHYSEEGGDFDMLSLNDNGDTKPILRPMSDLHKDIDGKISIKELWVMGLFGYHLKDKDIHPDLLSEWELSDLMDNISFDNYEKLFDYLYQNHFDIHGLIEQGLAIDINTL